MGEQFPASGRVRPWRPSGVVSGRRHCARPRTRATPTSFDERLEARERFVPLLRDAVEVRPHGHEARGLQPIETLAAGALPSHDAGSLQHAQMLGDRLSRQRRALRQSRDRQRRAGAEPADQRQARGIAERGKQTAGSTCRARRLCRRSNMLGDDAKIIQSDIPTKFPQHLLRACVRANFKVAPLIETNKIKSPAFLGLNQFSAACAC